MGFLLSHSFIEAYLLELLFYSSNNTSNIPYKISKNIERLNFSSLLTLNFLIGNISFNLYNKIDSLNKKRNEWVHDLRSINFKDSKMKKDVKRAVLSSKKVLLKLGEIYQSKIYSVSEKFS